VLVSGFPFASCFSPYYSNPLHPNKKAHFQVDLDLFLISFKLLSVLSLRPRVTSTYNCRLGKGAGACSYNNIFRNSIVVYQVKCNNTGELCIGHSLEKSKNSLKLVTNLTHMLHTLPLNSLKNQTPDPSSGTPKEEIFVCPHCCGHFSYRCRACLSMLVMDAWQN